MYTVCRSSKDVTLWNGFKEIQWGETLIPAEQFAGIGEGQKLEIVVRDVKPNAKVTYDRTERLKVNPTGLISRSQNNMDIL